MYYYGRKTIIKRLLLSTLNKLDTMNNKIERIKKFIRIEPSEYHTNRSSYNNKKRELVFLQKRRREME